MNDSDPDINKISIRRPEKNQTKSSFFFGKKEKARDKTNCMTLHLTFEQHGSRFLILDFEPTYMCVCIQSRTL